MKKLIIILLIIPLRLFSFDQTGPSGIDLWLMKIDDITGYVYATSYQDKLYKVDIDNNIWEELNTPESGNEILSLDVHNDVIFLGIGNHILRSIDGGQNWGYYESGIQYSIHAKNLIIYKPQPDIIFAQVMSNIWYRSQNNGISWIQLPNMGTENFDYSQNSDFILIMNVSILYKSYDTGISWEEMPLVFFNEEFMILSVSVINDSTYIACGVYDNDPLGENNIFITYDGGSFWENINFGQQFGFPTEVMLYNDKIYLTSARMGLEQHAGVFELDLTEEIWHQMGSGFSTDVTSISIEAYDNNIYLASLYEGIFKYNISMGTGDNIIPNNIYEKTIFSFEINPNFQNYIYQNMSYMYLSDDYGYTWTRIDSVYNITDVKQSPSNTDHFVALRARKGVYVSDDCAQTWFESNNGIEEQDRIFLYKIHFVNEDILLICGFLPNFGYYEITFIYRSADQGQSWVKVLEADLTQGEGFLSIQSLVKVGETLYATIWGQGVMKSEDYGLTWETIFNPGNMVFYQMEYDEVNGIFFLRTGDLDASPGITILFKSDDAINWEICSASFHEDYMIIHFEINPNFPEQIYCSVFNREGYWLEAPHFVYSENSGETWDEMYFDEFEPTNYFNRAVIIPATNEILVCPIGRSILRNELDFVEIEESNVVFYNDINLSNFPNPFNPSTTIQFNTVNTKNTEIIIYNIKGQRVRTFPNLQINKSSNQQIIWNGRDNKNLSVGSGIYFYKLMIGNEEIACKKMLLLK